MKNERFVNGLKNDGIAIVIIYFILSISLYLIDCILSGNNVIKAIMSSTNYNIPLNSIGGTSGKLLAIYTIIAIVMSLIFNAGLYGSSNDIIEGKPTSFSAFLKNGKKYFLRTLGYTLLYSLAIVLVMGIPFLILSYFASFSNIQFSNIPFSNISVIGTTLVTFIFQAIFIPTIILNVIDKDTKGYIKKNYVTLLIFSLIACVVNLIPIAGKFFSIILNGFYPLLIISMCDSVASTEHNKITIQETNNNDLLK